MLKSLKIDASTSLYPGESSELTRTVPSRLPAPTPSGQPAAAILQYAVVSNHSFLSARRDLWAPSVWANFPAAMLGRSLLSPSRLSSLPLVIANVLPLCMEIVASMDQPFKMVRVAQLKLPKLS